MAPSYEQNKLRSLKRAELQKLAKKHGIKANMKTDELISALQAAAEEKPTTAKVTEQETTISACSSMEDQSEPEVSEAKPRSRRGRGHKQKAVKSKTEDTPAETEAVNDKSEIASCPEPETSSSTIEDETVSPAAKKSKTKAKRRGRGQGRKVKKDEEEENEKLPEVSPAMETKPTTPVAASPVVAVISPTVKINVSRRGKEVTPVVGKPEVIVSINQSTVPTPTLSTHPNSAGTRRTMRATRNSSQTPPTPAQLTIPDVTTTPEATPEVAPKTSYSKKTRSANKTVPAAVTATKTPEAPADAEPKGSTGKRTGRSSPSASEKVRRSTFDKSPSKSPENDIPSAAPKANSNLKDEILAEIEKKVELAKSKTGIPTRVPLAKKTPSKRNWSKTHHGAFDKMESIGDYIERKRKRTKALTQSAAKRAKMPVIVKSATKPTKPNKLSFASPKQYAASPAGAKSAGPSKSVSFKMSKLKTPSKPVLPSFLAAASSLGKRQATPGARKSASVLTPGATTRKSVGGVTPGITRKSLGSAKTPSRKSVGSLTPFKPSASTTPAAKNAFDLKASLSRPLAYKPHAGKLKPFSETCSSIANVKPPSNIVNAQTLLKRPQIIKGSFEANVKPPSNIDNAKTLLKRPQIKGRASRRVATMRHKADKRNDNFMAKRGISRF